MRGLGNGAGPGTDGPGKVPRGRGWATAVARYRTLPQDEPILRFRLAAILAAQLFDFATFNLMVNRHGIDAELNPLVQAGFEVGGITILFLVKLALIVLVGSTIAILGRRRSTLEMPSRLAALIAVLAVFGGVFGGVSNFITI